MMGVRSSSCPLVTAACGALLAGSSTWIPLAQPGPFWIARVLGVLATAGLMLGAPSGGAADRHPLAASPLALLPVLTFTLYSFLPAATLSPFYPILPLQADTSAEAMRTLTPGMFTSFAMCSSAERAVLAFCGAGFLLATAFDRLVTTGRPLSAIAGPHPWGLVLILGGGIAFQLGKAAGATGVTASLCDALPALVVLGLMLVVAPAVGRERRFSLIQAVALLLAGLALYPYQTKTLILALGSLLFATFVVATWRQRLVVTTVAIILALSSAVAINVSRGITYVGAADVVVLEAIRWKVVLRQSETLFCLAVAIRDAEATANRREPLYFVTSLVPRILWPDKPSLSNGSAYGQRFCGLPPPPAGMPIHSASVTLLGEPWIEAGAPGLAAAGICLAVIAALLAWIWKRGPAILVTMVLALSPWIIDFDQHFSMWLGNLTKSALAMLLVVAAMELGRRSWAAGRAR